MKKLFIALLTLALVLIPSCNFDNVISKSSYELPQVTNIGVSVSGDTAYVVYTTVAYAEDGWLIERAVKDNGCTKLVLHLANGGGNVYSMFDVCNVLAKLRNEGIHITTISSGITASAAVPIFVQGDVRIILRDSVIMMHPGGWQGHEDLIPECMYCEIDRFEEGYALLISERTNLTYDEVMTILNTGDSETGQVFFTAKEAVEAGLATEIR